MKQIYYTKDWVHQKIIEQRITIVILRKMQEKKLSEGQMGQIKYQSMFGLSEAIKPILCVNHISQVRL